MFTGIVEETGTIKKIEKGTSSGRLTVEADKVLQGMPDDHRNVGAFVYGRCDGRDDKKKQSRNLKLRQQGKSGTGDGGRWKIWWTYRIRTYRRNRGDHRVH